MNRVITISREFGSGGRTIGQKVAERLGIPCYDQDLLDRIAEESGLTKEYIEERTENTKRSWFANAFADRSLRSMSTQDYVWSVQKKIVLDVAEKGPCVIIGRCADYILKDVNGEESLPNCNDELLEYRNIVKYIYSKSSKFNKGDNPLI